MSLGIRRLSYALGAEITGIDIRQPMDPATLKEVRVAFLEHLILLFRGQPITREQHIAFTKQFGEIDSNEGIASQLRHQDYPEISVNRSKPNAAPSDYKGEYWHSDKSFTCVPAMASILHSVEIPPVGGDTMFVNMYLAYDTLSEQMKKVLDGLHGIHVLEQFADAGSSKGRHNQIAQPIVRVHPETGRKALYLAEIVKQIVNMTAAESQPLLNFLCSHSTRPQFAYRHVWQKDDVIMWDNRCTMHNALGDYDRSIVRHMERTTVRGTPSGYVYDGPLE